jgi:ligand-binding sensor domain-containing protein
VGVSAFGYRVFTCLILYSIASCINAAAQESRRYLPEDWVSYTDLRYVRSIAYDHRYVFFGTSGGVGRYNRLDERWEHPFTESDGLPGRNVVRVGIDRQDSNLWAVIEMEQGGRYNRVAMKYWEVFQEWRQDRFSESMVIQQEVKFKNDLRYSFLYPHFLQDDFLRIFQFSVAVEEDRPYLWVGTDGAGIIRYYLPTQESRMMKRGPIKRDVSAILIDGDEVWMGGRGGSGPNQTGISRFNRASNEWEYYEVPFTVGLRSAEVLRIVADSSGIYLGTRLGLSRYEPPTDNFRTYAEQRGLFDPAILSLALSPGHVWIGTHFGLYTLDADSSRIYRVELPGLGRRAIWDLFVSADTIYAATDFGVYQTVDNGTEWTRFQEPFGDLGFGVSRIASDGEVVWFAYSSGVIGFDSGTGEFERYPSLQYGFSDIIMSLAADKDNLWIGTDAGLVKLDRQTGIWYRYTRTQDRLLDDRVQCLVLEGDYLWIGSPSGLTRFYWNDPYRPY